MPGLVIVGSNEPDVWINAERELLALERLFTPRRSELLWDVLLPPLTQQDIRARVEELQPNFVHFVGHGRVDTVSGEPSLVLQVDSANLTANWTQSDVVEVLGRASGLRLVVLNACSSSANTLDMTSLGEQVHTQLGCAVVGHRSVVASEHALRFTQGFYGTLSLGGSLDACMEAGVIGIRGSADDRAGADAEGLTLWPEHGTGVVLPPAPPTNEARLAAQEERIRWKTLDFSARVKQQLEVRQVEAPGEGLIPNTRTLIIHGPPRSGKSSFALNYLERAVFCGRVVRYVDFAAWGDPQTTISGLLEALCAIQGVGGSVGASAEFDDPLSSQPFDVFWQHVREAQGVADGEPNQPQLPLASFEPSRLDVLIRAFVDGLAGQNGVDLVFDHLHALPPDVLLQPAGGLAQLVQRCTRVDSIRILLVTSHEDVPQLRTAVRASDSGVEIPLISRSEFVSFGEEEFSRSKRAG